MEIELEPYNESAERIKKIALGSIDNPGEIIRKLEESAQSGLYRTGYITAVYGLIADAGGALKVAGNLFAEGYVEESKKLVTDIIEDMSYWSVTVELRRDNKVAVRPGIDTTIRGAKRRKKQFSNGKENSYPWMMALGSTIYVF